MNINAAPTHESRTLHRIVLGGIMAAILVASTFAFAGEASARKPRGSSQDAACVQLQKDYRENVRLAGEYNNQFDFTGLQYYHDLAVIALRHAREIRGKLDSRCTAG